MRKATTLLLTILAVGCLVGSASALQYPPGPGGAYPDTVSLWQTRNPIAIPHPVPTDTVYGVGGIVIGFDAKPSGFAFYIENSGPTRPWTGIDIFTGATNKGPGTPWNFQLGDSVIVYGKMQNYQGEPEIEGYDASQSTDDVICRLVSSGHPVPAFYNGTVHEFYETPTNPQATQWQGQLVKVNGPLRVARNSLGGGLSFNTFLLVDNTIPSPAESLFIDGNTLANYTPPTVGTLVDWVQGIVNQRTRGFRIQLRDGNDISVATPPNLQDAYCIYNDTIQVVFDRDVTQASAENLANYTLGSIFDVKLAAIQQVNKGIVHLAFAPGLPTGANESVKTNNIVGLANGLQMTTAQTRFFTNGLLSVKMVQGPNPDSLISTGGCKDVANFIGPANGLDTRISVVGTEVVKIGSLYYFADEDGGLRSGMAVFAPLAPLTQGDRYLVVGEVVEFPSPASGESELNFIVYQQNRGPGKIPDPVRTYSVLALSDTTCDATQTIENGEDHEGTLTKLEYVKIVPWNPPSNPVFNPGNAFRVAGPNPTFTDTITISNAITRTFLPDTDLVVSVTGINQFNFGVFRFVPRGDADIVVHGYNVGVPKGDNIPAAVSFSVYPNPARNTRIFFGLPRRDQVELGIFDIQGRQVAMLQKGVLDAGTYSRQWTGLDASGKAVGAGVYFYRLKVGNEVKTFRGIKLN